MEIKNENLTNSELIVLEKKETNGDDLYVENMCCFCKNIGISDVMISLEKALQDNIFVEAIQKMYPEFVSIISKNI